MVWYSWTLLIALVTSAPASGDPEQILAAAYASLQLKQTEAATELLNSIVESYPRSPQAVIAHHELSGLSNESGHAEAANEHNRLAWALFKKNSRSPLFLSHEVVHAASDARWNMIEAEKIALEAMFQAKPFAEDRCRKAVRELEESCTELMMTDVHHAAQAQLCIGDAHRLMADALLVQGKAIPGGESPQVRVLPEYSKAVSAYAIAFEKALGFEEQKQDLNHAAHLTFDVTMQQGDLMVEWGNEVFKLAPTLQPGTDSRKQRLDYLLNEVMPALSAAVNFYVRATDRAQYMPVKEDAAALQTRLDLPLQPLIESISSLHKEYGRDVRSSAVELGSMSRVSLDPKSTVGQLERVEAEFERLQDVAAQVRQSMRECLKQVPFALLPAASQSFWHDHIIRDYAESTEIQQILQDNVAGCLSRVVNDGSVETQSYQRRLKKLQAAAVGAEYHDLMAWHEYVTTAKLEHPLNERLYARLAEVDPASAPNRDKTPPSSNRKP